MLVWRGWGHGFILSIARQKFIYRSDWPQGCQLGALGREQPVLWTHVLATACVTLSASMTSSPKLGKVLDFASNPLAPALVRGEGYECEGQSLQHCFSLGWASW